MEEILPYAFILFMVIALIFDGFAHFKSHALKEKYDELYQRWLNMIFTEQTNWVNVREYYMIVEFLTSYNNFLKKENYDYFVKQEKPLDIIRELYNVKVLVHCSNFETQKELRHILLSFGCDVDLAFSVDEILFLTKDEKHEYKIIISDGLNTSNGRKIVKYNRNQLINGSIICFLSSSARDIKDRTINKTFDSIITTPLNRTKIKNNLTKAIDKKEVIEY